MSKADFTIERALAAAERALDDKDYFHRRPGTGSTGRWKAGLFTLGTDLVFGIKPPVGYLLLLGADRGGRVFGRTFHIEAEGTEREPFEQVVAKHWKLAKERQEAVTDDSGHGSTIIEGALGWAFRDLGIHEAHKLSGTVGSRHDPRLHGLRDVLEYVDFDALAIVGWLPDLTSEEFNWVSGDRLRKDLCSRYPGSLRTILDARQVIDAGFEAGKEPPHAMLDAYGWRGDIPASLLAGTRTRDRLVLSLESMVGTEAARWGLPAFFGLGLPLERLPSSRSKWEAFGHLYNAAYGLAREGSDWMARLMDVPGGQYVRQWANAQKIGLVQALLRPEHEGEKPRLDTFSLMIHRTDVDLMAYDYLFKPVADAFGVEHDRLEAVHWIENLLFRSNSLVRALETVDAFHSQNPAFSEALAMICGKRRLAWKCPTARKEIQIYKLNLRWLTTPRELIDEGRKGPDPNGIDGLDHCVAGYIVGCLGGRSHILSIRSKEGGRWKRLSTAELVWSDEEGRMAVIQHRGMSNGEPPREAEVALRRFVEYTGYRDFILPLLYGPRQKLPSGVTYSGMGNSIAGLVRNKGEMEAMLAVFEPWFPKDWRGLGLEGFAEMLRHEWSPESRPGFSSGPA